VGMATAAHDGAMSRILATHAAAIAALTGQNAGRNAASDPGQQRLLELELSAQAVDSALGFGALAPGARLQHEITAEVERAKHRALWVRTRAIRRPGSGNKMGPPGTLPRTKSTSRPSPPKLHSSAPAGYPERCSQPGPGTDTAPDNDQLQAFAAAHLGLGARGLPRNWAL
jgi:hypothetical protein